MALPGMNPPAPETHFFVFRHGETIWNQQERLQGHGDSPLTERGQHQARQIARRLQSLQPEALISSDLGRARQTAAIIADPLSLTPHFHPGLRERNLGIFEGLTLEDCRNRYPDEYAAWRSHDPAYAVPGGESVMERTARVISTLEEIATSFQGQRIVIITHGGCLDSLLRHTLHIPLNARRAYKLPNAAFNHFTLQKDPLHWTLLTWGDSAHLTDV